MVCQAHSQTISTTRVRSYVNTNGDTLIEMTLADARVVLSDLLQKQVADSIINVYIQRDSLNTSIVTLQRNEINLLQQKAINDGLIVKNLNSVITNKDEEITLLNDVIKKQKREIFKQKVLKVVGSSMAVIIPVIILILTH
jgi:hypothetical protein